MIIVFFILSFFFGTSFCADKNQILGSTCSGSDKSTKENDYQTNFDNLMNLLAKNAPLNNGFYTAITGKDSNKIYGLAQCRGDLSPDNCASCVKEATLDTGCSDGKSAELWFNWCLLQYSNESFFGQYEKSGSAYYNKTDLEDPNIVSQGLNFVNDLVTTTPNQPLMFQTKVLDVGKFGKRYALAQCTRDVSGKVCRDCFDNLLTSFGTTIGIRKNWEAFGRGCGLWYYDFKFYFNYTLPVNQDTGSNSSPRGVVIGLLMPVLMLLFSFSFLV